MTGAATAGALRRWVERVCARPRLTLVAAGALAAACAVAAALWLSVNSDSSRLLSPDLPFQRRAHALDAAFPELARTILVVLKADAPETEEAAARAIAAALDDAAPIAAVHAPAIDPFFLSNWPLYRSERALSSDLARLSAASNLIARLRVDQSVGGFLTATREAAALAERSGDPAELDAFYAESAAVWAARRQGLSRPLSWRRLLSGDAARDRRPTILAVTPRLDPTRISPARPALDAIGAAIARLPPRLAAGAAVAVTGEPAMRAEELRSVTRGLALSFGASFAAVAAILVVGLRSLRRAALTLGILIVTLAITSGLAAVALGPLNLISVAFIVLMVGLGVDFAIHFLAHLAESPPRGAAAVAAEQGGALTLAAATTSASFLAFGLTEFSGLAQLGLIGGVGVLIAFAAAVTVAPAAAAVWPSLARAPRLRDARPRLVGRRGAFRRGGAAALAAAAAAVVATEARFDANPLNLRPDDAPAARAFAALAADARTTPYRLHLLTPDRATARAAAARLEAAPQTASVRWIEDFVPRDQDAKLALVDLAYPSALHALDGAPAALAAPAPPGKARARLIARLSAPGAGPGAAAFAAELRRGDPAPAAALEADLFRHFPALLDRLRGLAEVGPVAEADLPDALRRRFVAPDGATRLEIAPVEDLRDPAAMRRFVEAVVAIAPAAAGPPDQIVGAERAVGRALLMATALALAATTAMTFAATRRARDTLAVVAPVAAAAAATAAATVLLDAPFNYANIIVVPLLIGFGVDSGVYLARAARAAPGGAFATATPRAVLTSAATTAAAFGALALSPHPGTASMGLLLVVALAASVIAAFTLTPAILALGRGQPGAP